MDLVRTVSFIIGYVLMVGPPRAFDIQASQNRPDSELYNKPISVILLVEFIARSGVFLILVTSLESLAGRYFFEIYNADMITGILILAGIVHAITFFLVFQCLQVSSSSLVRLYRLGRNFAYSILPALLVFFVLLHWQFINQVQQPDQSFVKTLFLFTWACFLFAGLLEAIIKQGIPVGLGKILRARLQG